ncbi:protoporphyrinogen/coproporphyrinogen oxidase [Arthrobacter halodurans]|uniref:NAD(P)/FAD-dependent oxidoreductase n=1 Tax=Arthrobacter halodurans TaxID=516699 RepID=A0ABV4UQT6_9MICC
MPHRSARPTEPARPDDATARAVVIGGGIAGLVAARELSVSGHAVELFESSGAFGGSVGAHTVAGLALDAGADSFATRNTAVADLLGELGLGDDIVLPLGGGAWLYSEAARHGDDGGADAGAGDDPATRSGRTATAQPLPQTGILGIPGDPWADDVKSAIGAAGCRRAAADLDMPVAERLADQPVSLGELVRARMGGAVLEALVAPVVSGVHSADPDTLDVDTVAPGLRAALVRHGSLARAVAAVRAAAPAGSAVAGISGGMHRLAAALVEDLRDRGVVLHPEHEVLSVARGGTEGDGGGARRPWSVVVRGAGAAERSVAADRVVVATDGPTAVDLLAPLSPDLSRHRPARGAGVALVTLVVDRPELDDAPRGTGLLVAAGAPGVTAKALTHATAKWAWLADEAGPGTHVLRLSFGRVSETGARLADAPDGELFRAAVADAGTLLGVALEESDVLGWDVVRYGGALPFATTGHRDRVAAFRAEVGELEGIDVVGAWLSGTGLAAVVSDTRDRLGISAT